MKPEAKSAHRQLIKAIFGLLLDTIDQEYESASSRLDLITNLLTHMQRTSQRRAKNAS